jgi:hypothetical protein
MSTTRVDKAMDIFMDNELMYQMNEEELNEYLDRVNQRLFSLILWAKETEADRELEMRSDAEEEPYEIPGFEGTTEQLNNLHL